MRNTALPIGVALILGCLPAANIHAQESHAGHDMSSMDHSQMDHSQHAQAGTDLPPGIPPVTDADRAAAFPDLGGMSMSAHMNDDPVIAMVLVDRLELRGADAGTALVWDAKAWVGNDRNRLYLRSEGEAVEGTTEDAKLEVYGARPVSRWWNLTLGLRQDLRPRESRSWLSVGTFGLAPYRVGVQATAYVGDAGRTAFRLETEYDLLLTNRLILQPRLELNAYGKEDPSRGIGSGVSSIEAGLRLRYELRREVAPYVGVAWVGKLGSTGSLARAAGQDGREWQAVAGLRVWF